MNRWRQPVPTTFKNGRVHSCSQNVISRNREPSTTEAKSADLASNAGTASTSVCDRQIAKAVGIQHGRPGPNPPRSMPADRSGRAAERAIHETKRNACPVSSAPDLASHPSNQAAEAEVPPLSFFSSARMSLATSSTSRGTRGCPPNSHWSAVVTGSRKSFAGEASMR